MIFHPLFMTRLKTGMPEKCSVNVETPRNVADYFPEE